MDRQLRYFEVGEDRLAALAAAGLGLTWAKGSLFEGHLADEGFILTEEEKVLISDEAFQVAAAAMAEPKKVVIVRSGGGTVAHEVQYVYQTSKGEEAVAVGMTQEGHYGIALFPSMEAFGDHWADTFGGRADDFVPNVMPDVMTLEQLMMVFHAIDYYRYTIYEQLLTYEGKETMAVPVAGYAETMAKALVSEDIRWLLPAFLNLTPGISRYNFDLKAADIKVLMELDLVAGVVPKDRTMVFSEAGLGLCNEFFRSWLAACGIEIWLVEGDVPVPLREVFVAPTALSNHLFVIEPDTEKGTKVIHKPLGNSAFGLELAKIITAGTVDAGTKSVAVTSETSEAKGSEEIKGTVQKTKYCAFCGTVLKGDAKFCSSCGKEVGGPASD